MILRIIFYKKKMIQMQTNLVVADNTPAIVADPNGRNCDVATATNPLVVYRVPPTTTSFDLALYNPTPSEGQD